MRFRPFFPLALIAASSLAQADPALQGFLVDTLAAAREKHALPAVAALVQVDGAVAAEAAVGLRALGQPAAVTVDDIWHIGSNTKAITATMIARLVEQGVMRFDWTLAKTFPGFENLHPDYREVTVRQLLSHTAGLPPLTDDADLPEFMRVIEPMEGVTAERSALARHYLAKPPATPAGEFAYSNLGYIIAGAIAEARTGKSWELLVEEQVFAPLGIVHAGFGAPGTAGAIDQPRGHKEAGGALVPLDPTSAASDNPPALGPAGTVHITLRDWARFAQDQLDGARGHGKLLKPETYRLLHTPATGVYALGWGTRVDANGAPTLLTHTGSNGYWYADVRILPEPGLVILIATNAGNEAAAAATKEIREALTNRLAQRE